MYAPRRMHSAIHSIHSTVYASDGRTPPVSLRAYSACVYVYREAVSPTSLLVGVQGVSSRTAAAMPRRRCKPLSTATTNNAPHGHAGRTCRLLHPGDMQPVVDAAARAARASQTRRGCACCDCRKVVARIFCGGVWLGSRNAPHAAPQRCFATIGCWRRSPFTCCVRQRFGLADGDLELRLKACDHYDTYQQNCQPGAAAVVAPRYKFEMCLRTGDPRGADSVSSGVGGTCCSHTSPMTVVVGNIQLRLGHGDDLERYAGHLGYYVSPAYRGKRYAQRSCCLLLELARWHGLSVLWITCNPDNVASRRTAERLGAVLIETVELPGDNPQRVHNGETEKCRYQLSL